MAGDADGGVQRLCDERAREKWRDGAGGFFHAKKKEEDEEEICSDGPFFHLGQS